MTSALLSLARCLGTGPDDADYFRVSGVGILRGEAGKHEIEVAEGVRWRVVWSKRLANAELYDHGGAVGEKVYFDGEYTDGVATITEYHRIGTEKLPLHVAVKIGATWKDGPTVGGKLVRLSDVHTIAPQPRQAAKEDDRVYYTGMLVLQDGRPVFSVYRMGLVKKDKE